KRNVGTSPLGDLDLDRVRWRDPYIRPDAHHPRTAGDARAELADHRQDGGRIHVDAADDEHVVAAAQDAHAEARALALAGGALDAHDVAAEEAHHRHRLARERGVDQLADRAGLDLHGLATLGVDQLHPHVARAAEVHALLVGALPEERRRDVADAHHLGHGHAEDPLDVIAN